MVFIFRRSLLALVIVESLNKIPKIKKVLGNGYVVMSSIGHIMDLAKKNMGITIPGFIPKYDVNVDKKSVVASLKEEAKNHDVIYIATDEDREGECIAFNLKEILPSKGKTVERVVFKSMTKVDIDLGLKNPVGFNSGIFDSQQARRMTDRIVGFKVSPLMWNKGLRGTSAGRVQSAALKFVVDREKEIRAFVEQEYWSLMAVTKLGFDAEFYGINGSKVVPASKLEVDNIIKAVSGDLTIADYQNKTRDRDPVAPYITSSMQKDAGTRFGWTSKRVMDVAQSLFAQGLITYHRTDSTRTEPGKLIDIRDRIEKTHGKKYLSLQTIIYAPKGGAQDAHEAIRPTYDVTPATLTPDESKLLELVDSRFTASQMASASFDQVAAKLTYKNGKNEYEFRTNGSIMTFDGFLKVYGTSTKDKTLPSLSVGQIVKVKKFDPEQHFTKPPARYTEPSFTDKMEKEGIGRPATYVATIETLLKRKYVTRDKKSLKATEIGIMVCDYLDVHFDKLTSPLFTADMEKELDDISQGSVKIIDVLTKFYDQLIEDIDKASKNKSLSLFVTDKDCPDCKGAHKLVKKISKYGVFMGCESYPTCGYTLVIDENGDTKEVKVETGLACPDCGSKVIKRAGKFGDFFGCSAYPTCKWTGQDDGNGGIAEKKASGEETDVSCPSCDTGKMIKRKGKFGEFLGCNQYPKCKTTIKLDENGNQVASSATKAKKPAPKSTGKTCPKCNKNDLVERDGKFGKFISCSGYPKCKHIEK